MKAAGIGIAAIVGLLLVAWAVGVRIFVVQPIGAIPEGVTAIVWGVHSLRPIDSPDAFCYRQQGGVSLICRGTAAAMVARQGVILARLPYSETLFRWTGGPFRDD